LFAGAPAVLGSPPDVRFGNAARNVIHAIAAAWRGVDEAEAKLRADFDAVASMAP
jgi:hypothetical protein